MSPARSRNHGAPNERTRPSNRRSSGGSPEAMTALAGRIRALQRSEPIATGEARSAAIARLTAAELQLERLVLQTWRSDVDRTEVLAETFALAQEVDQLARLWPNDSLANLAVAAAHRPRRPERFDPDRKAA